MNGIQVDITAHHQLLVVNRCLSGYESEIADWQQTFAKLRSRIHSVWCDALCVCAGEVVLARSGGCCARRYQP